MPFLAPAIGAITTAIQGAAIAVGFSAATALTIATSVVQFGISYLLSAAASAIFSKKPKAEDVGRELSQQTSAPAYRSVYGECRATGTPAGIPVKGKYIYGAWILNSRPSYLPDFTLYLDKREVLLTGDAFDLNGPGATGTEFPFENAVWAWISRGDQTAPPKVFTDEAPWIDGTAPHLWKATDAWKGRTIIWLKLNAGGTGNRQERWPSAPPLVEVEGKWSFIYDERKPAHDPDDASTWEWSDNHALCVRDVLRTNPIRAYLEDQLHGSFKDGADVCDEIVSLNSGGTERRYTCAGTVMFSEGEIEDQVNPMVISGAASLIRVGGQLGYAAGEYRAPTMSLDYLLGDGFEFPDMLPGDELVNEIRATYLSPARGYETAELQPWPIPGALAEDGGVPTVKTLDLPFCRSATQAMRVRKIVGLRQRRQERISGGDLPPEAFDLVGGATVSLSLPAPYDVLNGVYEVESIHPGADPVGDSGQLALRMPADLVKHSAAIYAWNPATDEETVFDEAYDGTREGVAMPGALSVTSGPGVDLDTGAAIVPRFKFTFAPSVSISALAYEWEWRLDGNEWQSGGSVDAEIRDGSGNVFFYLPVADLMTGHDVRVRTIGEKGRSDWRELTGAIYLFEITGGGGTGGWGSATLTGTAPASSAFLGVRVYYGPVGSAFSSATLDANGTTPVDPGATFSVVAGEDGAANLIVNGTFDDATGWTLGSGWSIAGGEATKAPSASNSAMVRAATMTAGRSYRWSLDMVRRVGGTLYVRLVGSSTVQSSLMTTTGEHYGTIVAPAAPTQAGFYASGPTGDFSVDYLAMFEETAAHLPQGEHDFWIVPVTLTKSEGAPVGPFTLTII